MDYNIIIYNICNIYILYIYNIYMYIYIYIYIYIYKIYIYSKLKCSLNFFPYIKAMISYQRIVIFV